MQPPDVPPVQLQSCARMISSLTTDDAMAMAALVVWAAVKTVKR